MTTRRPWIILAAGAGRRLGPLAAGRPKAMAPLHGRGLIEWQLGTLAAVGVTETVLVRGAHREQLPPAPRVYDNTAFDRTNMVYSLLLARDAWTDGAVVSYGDTVFNPAVAHAAIAHAGPGIGVVVDTDWRHYWAARGDTHLTDAETLTISNHRITDIGRPVTPDAPPEAQYIGTIAFGHDAARALIDIAERAAQADSAGRPLPDPGKPLPDWYLTDLLRLAAAEGVPLVPLRVGGGWLEVDTPADLALAERMSTPGAPLVIDRRAAFTEEPAA